MKTSFKSDKGTIISLISIILALAGIVIYVINASGSYYHDFHSTVILIVILGIVIDLAFLVLSHRQGEKNWLDLFYPVVGAIFMLAAIVFVSRRVESAGIILGSDLEAGNTNAINSLIQAFIGIGCLILASLATGISAFFGQVRTK